MSEDHAPRPVSGVLCCQVSPRPRASPMAFDSIPLLGGCGLPPGAMRRQPRLGVEQSPFPAPHASPCHGWPRALAALCTQADASLFFAGLILRTRACRARGLCWHPTHPRSHSHPCTHAIAFLSLSCPAGHQNNPGLGSRVPILCCTVRQGSPVHRACLGGGGRGQRIGRMRIPAGTQFPPGAVLDRGPVDTVNLLSQCAHVEII